MRVVSLRLSGRSARPTATCRLEARTQDVFVAVVPVSFAGVISPRQRRVPFFSQALHTSLRCVRAGEVPWDRGQDIEGCRSAHATVTLP